MAHGNRDFIQDPLKKPGDLKNQPVPMDRKMTLGTLHQMLQKGDKSGRKLRLSLILKTLLRD